MRRFLAGMALLTAGALLGCGSSGPPLAPVEGVVTLDGEPLEAALVEFQPTSPAGSPSYGETDERGRFELMFSQQRGGAWVGEGTVRISTMNENERVREKVPPKYNTDTTLIREVVAGEKNEFDFALSTSDEAAE